MLNELHALLAALPHKLVSLSAALLVTSVVFVLAERWYPLHTSPTLRKNWLADVAYFFLGATIPAFVLLLVFHFTVAALRPLGPMPWHTWIGSIPAVPAFLASVVLSEVAYYWAHRLAHEVPLLWRFHAIHHSAEHVDWLVNTRAHPLDLSFMRAFIFVCMYVLGFAQHAPQPNDWMPAV